MRTAVALGVVYAGYTFTLWGYCLVKGYDVRLRDLFRTTWPGVHFTEQAPSGGHKLGTITSPGVSVTNPGQTLG